MSEIAERMAAEIAGWQGNVYAVIRGTGTRQDGRWVDYDMLHEYSGQEGALTLHPTGEVERRHDGALALVVRPDPDDTPLEAQRFQITDNQAGTGKYHVSRTLDEWQPICGSSATQRRNGHTRPPATLQATLNQLQTTISRHLWCRGCWVAGLRMEAPGGEPEEDGRPPGGRTPARTDGSSRGEGPDRQPTSSQDNEGARR